MTQTMSETPSSSAIYCPGCQKYVEELKYPEHVNSNHQLHRIDIKGLGTTLIPAQTTAKPQPRILDLPYIGRVRADAFVIYTLLMLILGVLMGARII